MPKEEKQKSLTVDELRYAEYYGMMDVYDELYDKSKKGEIFADLMSIILQRENILLAYRTIKTNTGSKTAGTDKLTIQNIGRLTQDEVVEKVRYIVTGSKHGYRPKPVRRKEIPKPNGDIRPLGIPCIWDRLVQQCIKQVMEPICEARFSEHSYGFRPNRSVEHAIARIYQLMQRSKLHYVVEFDIKGFFDNVNHSKLIKQIWALGIHDKHLIYIIKQILKAEIKLPNGELITPAKGTPQGGIISPLLANIVLNELDQWISGQWEYHPIAEAKAIDRGEKGRDAGNGYQLMRKTNLKEMHIVRYADDFRILCRTQDEAERIKIAVERWLQKRLKLELSSEKTKIVDVRNRYSEFLGFKIKLRPKGKKWVVTSHISDKRLQSAKASLTKQAKRIGNPRPEYQEIGEIFVYNTIVVGLQNYYNIATEVNHDCAELNRTVMTILTNRLRTPRGNRLKRTGRTLSDFEWKRYGKSRMLRYVSGTKEPIYPIGYVQHKKPLNKPRKVCKYTKEGRINIHTELRINTGLMLELMKHPVINRSTEYNDNRISLFSAQLGKCAVTGREFAKTDEIHCHHKLPKEKGGTDEYENLVLVLKPVHALIHAVEESIISKYKSILSLNKTQIAKLNELRRKVGNKEI